MTNRVSGRALACALFLTTALVSSAFAQLEPPSPVRPAVDSHGVDLFDGRPNVRTPVLSIGPEGSQGLQYYKFSRTGGWTDNLIASLNLSGSTMTVRFGETTDRFTVSGTTYIPTEANGATLTFNSTTNIYTYTMADGTVIRFNKTYSSPSPYYSNAGRAADVVAPSGDKLVYLYYTALYCDAWKPSSGEDICIHRSTAYRVTTVRNNYGYQLTFTYETDDLDPDFPDLNSWSKVVGATATNLAVASGASTPSETFSESFGTNTYTLNATDPQGRVSKYRVIGAGVAGITLPGSTSEDITFTYTNNRVTSVVTPAGTTTYSAADALGVRTVTVTDPLNHTTVYKFDIASERLTSFTDANNHITAMQYDANGRLTRVTEPEGNYTQVTYDGRGNVTTITRVAKSGSGLPDIVTSASFPATCANPTTCNQPTTTTDARGKVTDYTYDSTHGGVLTVTAPAPTTGAVRPQTRFSYATLQAYFKNSSGSIVASGEPVVKLTGISACQTLATCTGGADETKVTVAYGPQTTGTGNNLLPVSVTRANGTGTLSAVQAFAYDDVGNLLTVDGPLSGTADTTRYRYNANRELVGTISPDPDGAGSLKNHAQRITYSAKGLVSKVENGTTAGQTDSAWTNFTPAEVVDITYDTRRRPATQKLSNGATSYALTQTSYLADDSVDCVATRMNPATYGSLPASACTLGTAGSNGPDRITKNIYDNAGNLTQVRLAVGVTEQANERTLTYTNNDQLLTLTDAEGNKTTYEYDGHDRLVKTRFPSPTKGAGTSSTTNYEQLTYENTSSGTRTSETVATFRNRAAETTSFTYDNLTRLTTKNLPGSEPDVTYAYDNLGRLTSASRPDYTVTFAYDALGRQTLDGQGSGSISRQFDLAGNLTRVSWWDGFYVQYDRLVTGEVDRIRENGATSGIGVLADYAYDNLGRRTSLTFGNGTSTSYAYDPVSRLQSLSHDLAGTANDLTIGSIAYNPASQIISQQRSNDAYAFTGHSSASTAIVANGLNQLTSIGGSTVTHDARGNLTLDPVTDKTYVYDSQNRLIVASGGISVSYDPLGRMTEYDTNASRRFMYDGLDVAVEVDNPGGTIVRRFVHGPGADEPIVQYEGSGTTGRRFLHVDERGSIIAVTDSSGAVLGINSYDEYGVPGASNLGLFGYTGQAWLPELGVYYYKARMYSPFAGGRFFQTDPIGYEAGTNLYAYVGNDPINFTDPLGLQEEEEIVVTAQRIARSFCEANFWACGSIFGGSSGVGSSGGGRGGGGSGGGDEDIVITARRTKRPTQCQINFLKRQLSLRGLPTSQLDDLKFVSGLDENASIFTRIFFGGAEAVTQGSTIYVNVKYVSFDKIANFKLPVAFHEAYHTGQFAMDGGAGFYRGYSSGAVGGVLTKFRHWSGNVYEAFAIGAGNQMFEAYKSSGCR